MRTGRCDQMSARLVHQNGLFSLLPGCWQQRWLLLTGEGWPLASVWTCQWLSASCWRHCCWGGGPRGPCECGWSGGWGWRWAARGWCTGMLGCPAGNVDSPCTRQQCLWTCPSTASRKWSDAVLLWCPGGPICGGRWRLPGVGTWGLLGRGYRLLLSREAADHWFPVLLSAVLLCWREQLSCCSCVAWRQWLPGQWGRQERTAQEEGWTVDTRDEWFSLFFDFWKWAHCYQLSKFLWAHFKKIFEFCSAHEIKISFSKNHKELENQYFFLKNSRNLPCT